MKKEFMIVLVRESNQYSLAFKSGKNWTIQSFYVADGPLNDSCLIEEKLPSQVNDLYELGYLFKGIVRVDTEKELWKTLRKFLISKKEKTRK